MSRTRFSNVAVCTALIGSLGLAAMAGGLGFSGIASAQQTDKLTKATDSDRYQLRRDGDNFVRLDKKTGTMSVCTMQSDNLVCRMAADEREALQAEMDDLQSRLDRIEDRMASSRRSPNPYFYQDMMPDEEFEQTMDRSEKILRRFFGVMKDLSSDLE